MTALAWRAHAARDADRAAYNDRERQASMTVAVARMEAFGLIKLGERAEAQRVLTRAIQSAAKQLGASL